MKLRSHFIPVKQPKKHYISVFYDPDPRKDIHNRNHKNKKTDTLCREKDVFKTK